MRQTNYICDRCGKEKSGHPEVDVEIRDMKIEHASWLSIHSKTKYQRGIDLCDDCLKSFKNWFETDPAEN